MTDMWGLLGRHRVEFVFFLLAELALLAGFAQELRGSFEAVGTHYERGQQSTLNTLALESEKQLALTLRDADLLSRMLVLPPPRQDDAAVDLDFAENLFSQLVNQREHLDQIRFIGANGYEQLRIERSDNERFVQASKGELQDKSERYYTRIGLSLASDEAYISRLDLNVENGVVEQPFKPVFRVVRSVYRSDQLLGIVVLNHRGDKMLAFLGEPARTPPEVELYAADMQGQWTRSPVAEWDWAFMFPEAPQIRVKDGYPDLWSLIQRRSADAVSTISDAGQVMSVRPLQVSQASLGGSVRLQAHPDSELFLIALSPEGLLQNEYSALVRDRLPWFMCSALGMAALFALFLRSRSQRDQEQIERERRLNDVQYLLDLSTDAMFVVDDDGVIIGTNYAMAEIFGYQREELVGRHVELLVPESARDNHHLHRLSYMVDPKPLGHMGFRQLRGVTKKGEVIDVDVSLNYQKTPHGLRVSCRVRSMAAQDM